MKLHGVLAFCLFLTMSAPVRAQGPLNPPGAPAPMMKSLDQVEPRIPISSIPTSITVRGSYYLVSNLTGVAAAHGITIASDDVSLDLNGFALIGVASALDGVNVSGTRNNIAIRNGTVRNWGTEGVDAFNAQNGQFMDLRAFANGTLGLRLGVNSLVKDCTAMTNANSGIYAAFGSTISGCSAYQNGVDGINSDVGINVTDCSASLNGDDGIEGGGGSSITRCSAGSNADAGIIAFDASSLEGNTCRANVGDGISVSTDCRVIGNTCDFNGFGAGSGAGIHATSGENRIEDNQLSDNDRGLDIDGTNNYVAGNTVRGNADNYDIAAGNQLNLLLGQIPQTIPWPASVKLAGTLTGISGTNGITISADNVTIDLDGHALVGVPGSLDGIGAPAVRFNLLIRNGLIANWGGSGVNVLNSRSSQFIDLRTSTNGNNGVRAGSSSLVKNCAAYQNGGDGIIVGASSMIADSVANANGGDGFLLGGGSSIKDSIANSNSGNGIAVGSNGAVERNVCSGNTRHGIIVALSCLVSGNTCNDNGFLGGDGAGIYANFSGNRIDGNSANGNSRGIDVSSMFAVNNLITRNSASGNDGGSNYVVKAATSFGVVTVSGPFTNTNPWVNFEF